MDMGSIRSEIVEEAEYLDITIRADAAFKCGHYFEFEFFYGRKMLLARSIFAKGCELKTTFRISKKAIDENFDSKNLSILLSDGMDVVELKLEPLPNFFPSSKKVQEQIVLMQILLTAVMYSLEWCLVIFLIVTLVSALSLVCTGKPENRKLAISALRWILLVWIYVCTSVFFWKGVFMGSNLSNFETLSRTRSVFAGIVERKERFRHAVGWYSIDECHRIARTDAIQRERALTASYENRRAMNDWMDNCTQFNKERVEESLKRFRLQIDVDDHKKSLKQLERHQLQNRHNMRVLKEAIPMVPEEFKLVKKRLRDMRKMTLGFEKLKTSKRIPSRELKLMLLSKNRRNEVFNFTAERKALRKQLDGSFTRILKTARNRNFREKDHQKSKSLSWRLVGFLPFILTYIPIFRDSVSAMNKAIRFINLGFNRKPIKLKKAKKMKSRIFRLKRFYKIRWFLQVFLYKSGKASFYFFITLVVLINIGREKLTEVGLYDVAVSSLDTAVIEANLKIHRAVTESRLLNDQLRLEIDKAHLVLERKAENRVKIERMRVDSYNAYLREYAKRFYKEDFDEDYIRPYYVEQIPFEPLKCQKVKLKDTIPKPFHQFDHERAKKYVVQQVDPLLNALQAVVSSFGLILSLSTTLSAILDFFRRLSGYFSDEVDIRAHGTFTVSRPALV